MKPADWFRGWEDFTRLRIPGVAAVSGFAPGGGCELAMMCDFIIAGGNAKFWPSAAAARSSAPSWGPGLFRPLVHR
jgi:enoyl-CoA hydratase/carnithine racemase